jgi:hypothetical protein
MGTAISWVFEAAIKPDGVDDYRALGREITADNEATEPGQMIFEWFIDDGCGSPGVMQCEEF